MRDCNCSASSRHWLIRLVSAWLLVATLAANCLPSEEYEYDELSGAGFTSRVFEGVANSSRVPAFSVQFDGKRATVGQAKVSYDAGPPQAGSLVATGVFSFSPALSSRVVSATLEARRLKPCGARAPPRLLTA